jgi:hypothetical protein
MRVDLDRFNVMRPSSYSIQTPKLESRQWFQA